MNEISVEAIKPVEVKDRSIYPVYVWRTGKTMFLSRKRKVVADVFIETRDYRVCRERLKGEVNLDVSESVIRRWLDLPEMRVYISERFEELGIFNGWTKEHWFYVMTKHLESGSKWEQAREDIKMYESDLGRNPKDVDAQVGLVNARERMLEANKDRLGTGDLYAMKLIGQFKGWDASGPMQFNQQINITQANGKG